MVLVSDFKLRRPSDWFKWIIIIEVKARNVWEFIDPEKATQPSITERPVRPGRPEGIKDLETELLIYEIKNLKYEHDLSQWELLQNKLQRVRTYIINSVDKRHILKFEEFTTEWELLRVLRKRFKPSNGDHQMMISARYDRLQTFDKKQSIEDWLNKWVEVYHEGTSIAAAEFQGHRAVWDFLRALRMIDNSWATSQWIALRKEEKSGAPIPAITDYIKEFRDYNQIMNLMKSTRAQF